jgi:hypothetical protein
MKFGELKSIGHNIADSLACGLGLPIGLIQTDIFGEASNSPDGYIVVDFLSGATEGGTPSPSLADAILRYREAIGKPCEHHGAEMSAFKTLKARFAVDRVYGWHFTVTVEDQNGRCSTDQFLGPGGRRIRKRRIK